MVVACASALDAEPIAMERFRPPDGCGLLERRPQEEARTMEDHVTAVGILRIGVSVLGVAGAIILIVILLGVGLATYSREEAVLPILSAVALGVGGFLLLTSIPGIIGGIGVLKRKNWARYLVLVLAVFGLLNFPVGTAIGAYTIWVLVSKRTVPLFEPESAVAEPAEAALQPEEPQA
jgi:hypothetical protein